MADTNMVIRSMQAVVVGLLVLGFILGLAFTVQTQNLKSTCNDVESGYYSGGECYVSATNLTAITSDAVDAIQDTITAMKLVIAFLTVIVLVLIILMLVPAFKKLQDLQ